MSRIRIGMLTPSSNTVVEPMTQAIIASLPQVSAHFARLRVTEISLSDAALAQFEQAPFLDAASMLADAHMHAIAWNGTSAAWKGLARDAELCEAIGTRFGVPATASMQALNAIFARTDAKRIGLVTPYTEDVQAKIVANYRAAGLDVVDERHLGIRENFAFSEIDPARIAAAAREVAEAGPDAIMIVCTNLRSPQLVAPLEVELGLPVYDSLSAVVWHTLRLAGVDTRPVTGWGSLFASA